MHGATQWGVMGQSFVANRVILVPKFEPAEVWGLIQQERVNMVMITGDAMGKPLVEQLDAPEESSYDLSSLLAVVSSAALFSAPVKDQFFERLPNLVITDAVGSSEGGNNGMTVITAGNTAMKSGPTVHLLGQTVVFDENLELVAPGSGVIGKIARSGDSPQIGATVKFGGVGRRRAVIARHPRGCAGQRQRLVKVISLPAALKPTSSMNVRTSSRPRPLDFAARESCSLNLAASKRRSHPGPSSCLVA